MTPVTVADIEINDVLCLPQPPYRPMVVTAKGAQVMLREYPPRASGQRLALSPEAFDAAGYVRYQEA